MGKSIPGCSGCHTPRIPFNPYPVIHPVSFNPYQGVTAIRENLMQIVTAGMTHGENSHDHMIK
jgi:hypothetical protein